MMNLFMLMFNNSRPSDINRSVHEQSFHEQSYGVILYFLWVDSK